MRGGTWGEWRWEGTIRSEGRGDCCDLDVTGETGKT